MKDAPRAECERFYDFMRASVGANVAVSDEQRSAIQRESTSTEATAAVVSWLAIGGYARLLAEHRMTIEAFHEAVSSSSEWASGSSATRTRSAPAGQQRSDIARAFGHLRQLVAVVAFEHAKVTMTE
jgi:hypothetical protein